MASYDNLMMEQIWSVRPAFPDAWFSDIFTKENETLAKALQSSFTGVSSYSAGMDESLFANPDTTPVQTPTVSGVSENDSLVPKKCRSAPPSGRVAKRKSRASKRAAMTTFIATDPENFMQMVQQVTGVSFGGLNEQPRPVARTHWATDFGLPTLDTSAFLLDGGAASYQVSQPPTVEADDGARSSEHYFDSFCSFPTLESWRAVE